MTSSVAPGTESPWAKSTGSPERAAQAAAGIANSGSSLDAISRWAGSSPVSRSRSSATSAPISAALPPSMRVVSSPSGSGAEPTANAWRPSVSLAPRGLE